MSYQLTIEPLGATIEVNEGQTMLDAALRHGIYLPHACGHGLCGSCKVQVCGGEVDHGAANPFALLEFEKDEGKTLACCATLQDDVTIEADIEEEPDAQIIPVQDFSAVVSKIIDLTPTIKAVYLRLSKAMHFQAGQYVQISMPASSGVEGSRAFSIANSPQAVAQTNEIELNVRIVPNGAMTSFIHQHLKVGDELNVTGPFGRFFVRKSLTSPMLFLAGGSGLSSPLSMIADLLHEGNQQAITLVVGQRNAEELYYHQQLLDLAAQHSNFTYVPALSDASDSQSQWPGAVGFVHEVAKQHFSGNFSGHKAYLCGPPPMIEAAINTLMQGRCYERDIYTERFLSKADVQNQKSPLFKRV